jgi:xanthine dehydrogenase molybdopterin binding subunit/xanthine dehydrogenase small subunit
MSPAFEFTLNGEPRRVDACSPTTTVLQYLRSAGLTGTKEGCAEGDCGACTIAVLEKNARGEATYRAVNACIALLPMLAGREVVTVEGVAGPDGLHPVQQAMVENYGSQCGYCTPGFVVSMLEAATRADLAERPQIGDQLCGNLCRCTGYRPIRDAAVQALAQGGRPHVLRERLTRSVRALGELDYEASGQRFARPTSLEALLALRTAHPDAVLVAGATEIGVDLNKKGRAFPFLISTEAVAELTAVTETPAAFHVGGAVTLTALEEALRGELPCVDKMLWVFASRQIRNRATLAGNLVTASPIGDMAPVLLALDAEVVLASMRGDRTLKLSEFFLSYRKTALAPDEIMRAIVIPRRGAPAGGRRLVDSYKVSKRRELDISIVAAAFAIDLDGAGVVQQARLAYGGVAATPARAVATERLLVGRPWDDATLREALLSLSREFSPIDDVRAGAAFRRGLIQSLFEKFFAGEKSGAQDAPITFDVGAPNAPARPSLALLHESARGHVTGSALYTDDEAQRRPMLEMWPVTAPHARARILSRDASAARAHPGIEAVLMAEDIPGENDVGAIRKDEILLAEREVFFHGQIVAVVVGRSLEACRRAAALVKVEYEPLPAVLDVRRAVQASSFHTDPHVIRRGDAAQAIAGSPFVVEGELEIGGQEHFYLESQAAWAEVGDDGDVFVVSSTQHPSEIQAVVAHVLHLPKNRVVVQSPRMGGGFGGKETQGNTWAALVALAAFRTGRPVRVQLDRDVDMIVTGKRHPFLSRYRAGFDGEGRLLGVEVDLFSDGGWALDLSESITDRALFHLDNAYYLPAVRFSGRVAKTNRVSNTAFRGFGGPQGMLVIEEILSRVARRLGVAAEDVREKNLYRGTGATNTTHYGQHLDDNRIERIWRSLRRSAELDDRRRAIARSNASSPRIKRGIAVTPVKFGISFTASFLNQAGALVLVYRDGTAQVNHAGTEMGQGLYTKVQGVAMRELGLSAARVRVMKTRTDKVPNTSATAASSGSDLNGAAVKNACEVLRGRLAEVAATSFGGSITADDIVFDDDKVFPRSDPGSALPFEAVVEAAYMRQVSLAATGFYRTPGLAYDKKAGQGRPFHYFAYGAAVAEVEVDGYSGMKRVLRVDILHDVGDSLNPGVDRGQIEGGFVQGMGWLTGEELKWDDKGRLLTHSASTYQIPTIGDVPPVFHVELLPDAAQSQVIHGSKAVGEPPLMLAISVREAIRDAIAAFGAPGGDVPLPCPATHEAIFHEVMRRLSPASSPAEQAAE